MESPQKREMKMMDNLREETQDQAQRIEELKLLIRQRDGEMDQMRGYLQNFEEESKKFQNQLLDERLAKEEAVQQLDAVKETTKASDRAQKDKKSIQSEALKKLEIEIEQKDKTIMDYKTQFNELEIQHMHNENLLRDELDLVKDRCNKLL